MKQTLKQINAQQVEWHQEIVPCKVGRNGFSINKKEGDGCTPIGTWKFLNVYYRPDKMTKPNTVLSVIEITPDMGWSDDPKDVAYNTCIKRPYAFSHEKLWRDDDLYDLLITIDHNTAPTIAGNGSAIFIHKQAPDCTPTEGCLALGLVHLKYLVETATHETYWTIGDYLA